jgi:hypothetical protein
MKRLFSMAALVALTTAGAATQASAEDAAPSTATAAPLTATAGMDINSAYIWRGTTVNNGLVFQPSMDIAKNGFDFNVWTNYDASDYHGTVEEGRFSEIDLTASYTFKLGSFDASVGAIEYTYPTTHPRILLGAPKAPASTGEVFVGLSKDLGAGFTAGAKVYYDFDKVNDFFIAPTLGYSYSLNDKTTLGLGGTVGYAGQRFAQYWGGGTDAGFFSYTLTASAKYMVTEAFGVGANINYTDSLNKNVLASGIGFADTHVFGGVSLTYAF